MDWHLTVDDAPEYDGEAELRDHRATAQRSKWLLRREHLPTSPSSREARRRCRRQILIVPWGASNLHG